MELKAQWHAKFWPNATKHSGVMGCQSWTSDVTVFKAKMDAIDKPFNVEEWGLLKTYPLAVGRQLPSLVLIDQWVCEIGSVEVDEQVERCSLLLKAPTEDPLVQGPLG